MWVSIWGRVIGQLSRIGSSWGVWWGVRSISSHLHAGVSRPLSTIRSHRYISSNPHNTQLTHLKGRTERPDKWPNTTNTIHLSPGHSQLWCWQKRSKLSLSLHFYLLKRCSSFGQSWYVISKRVNHLHVLSSHHKSGYFRLSWPLADQWTIWRWTSTKGLGTQGDFRWQLWLLVSGMKFMRSFTSATKLRHIPQRNEPLMKSC